MLLGVVSLMSTTRENLSKGKRKGNRSQSSEHLRPGNNCILRRITRSQSRVNNLYFCLEFCIWVEHWCTDVFWIRRIPNRNAAALLHNNIRNGQLLHRGCTVGFTVKPPRIQMISPQLVLLLELHYQSARVLHRGSQVLHHHGI